jgi:FkbM family methyltransferase
VNIARGVNGALALLGYHLGRVDTESSMEAGLRRAAARGIEVATFVDVGASDGRWSELARRHYPAARFLLIEANRVHEPGLRGFTERVAGSDYVLAAAADRAGDLYFDASDAFGGVASAERGEGMLTVPATTVDAEVAERALPAPYALKLDTHGFELPILAGASQVLGSASLLVVETYNFELFPGVLRFHELCAHLEQLGFRPIDLVDPVYRPKDGAFWQCDVFFARADRPEFQSNSFD